MELNEIDRMSGPIPAPMKQFNIPILTVSAEQTGLAEVWLEEDWWCSDVLFRNSLSHFEPVVPFRKEHHFNKNLIYL